jgi:hypothetical protein
MKDFYLPKVVSLNRRRLPDYWAMTEDITPHWKSLLDEFELDWRLAGLAPNPILAGLLIS